MNQQVRTRKSVIYTLLAGFGLGTIAMAGLQSGVVIPKAFAQNATVTARPISSVTAENMATLRDLDASFSNLAEFVAPAVVDIAARSSRAMGPNGERIPARAGEGSGFIFRSDGYIITNDHVVAGADKVTVTTKDGREYEGTVTRAEDVDIAVIKINADNLPVLAFADSNTLTPGQMCMAVGAPFGLENSVTFGHVSALGRDTGIADQFAVQNARYYPDLIQTDASINMGNSGGPLVNIEGQVIGVNTAIFSPTGTSAGIGFAIPSNQAKFIAEMLIEKGTLTRSMIGLRPTNLKEYEKKDLNLVGGARVEELVTPGPAAAAGIKDKDIITKIGDYQVRNQLDLRNAMLLYAPGQTVPVEVVRNGKTLKVKVKLEAAPKAQPVQQQPRQRNLPEGFEIPEGFDEPDIELFDRLNERLRNRGNQPQRPRQQTDEVPAIREGQARLGVSVGNVTDELRSEQSIPKGVSGAYVLEVAPGSIAEKLGIQEGDVITQVGDKPIRSSQELVDTVGKFKWGQSTRIKFERYSENSTSKQDMTVEFK